MIRQTDIVGFDTETTGLDVYFGADTILGFSIAVQTPFGKVGDYFPMFHPCGNNLTEDEWRPLIELILTKTLLIHNALFDITVMRNLDPAFEIKRYIDLMKMAHLIDENPKMFDLDSVAIRYLGHKVKDKSPVFEAAKLAYGWNMPAIYMYDYAKGDAIGLLDIWEAMQKIIATKESAGKFMANWAEREAPSIIGLTKMRSRGVRVVLETCEQEEAKGIAEQERVTQFFGFNPGSGKNLEKLLIDELGLPVVKRNQTKEEKAARAQTRSGNISFDKEAMKEYDELLAIKAEKENDPRIKEIARELFAYRGWTKAVTGYYRPYQTLISLDGRLRPEYKPHGTVTGRFSCADPNLQQIPKETDKPWNGRVKECLTGSSGSILWELDYSQLEFRLAASASKEARLLEVFADNDRDIFNEMSSDLGMTRQDTKGLTYSIQYGAGVARIMAIFGVSADEAKKIIANFYANYPNLKAASQYFGAQALQKGHVELWSGRRRHFSNPKKQYFKAFNSYIQGGAADIVKMVMNDCFREIDNDDCQLLLQVHDSLVFQIKIGMEDYYLPRIMEVMTRPSERFKVNLPVDAHAWSHRERGIAAANGISLTKDGGYELAA